METTTDKICGNEKILQKITRIAYEIAEDNYEEEEIILAGIGRKTEGYVFAGLLHLALQKILGARIVLGSVELDKLNPGASPVELSLGNAHPDKRVIVLADDVCNTGRTLLYAVKPLLSHAPKKIRIAVLVERRHKLFPISPDYVGISLSTTLHEHIRVDLGRAGDFGIFLS